MKVAIVHDYIKEYGGAERVLEALHEIWPEAPVFTTVYYPQFLGPHRERFANWDIRTSFLQKVPFGYKLISPFRILTPFIFEQFDFSSFDTVIVSQTGAYFPNMIRVGKDTTHFCYCHTPPRYLYGYPTARNWKKNMVGRIIGELMNHRLRLVDFQSGQRVDAFIANSEEVRARIRKFYRREAEVIYPPVELASSLSASSVQLKRQYYITGGRLARAKRVDLVIEACNRLKLPLKVFGRGFADYENDLRQKAGPTVEFVGEVSDEKLWELYFGARALLYASEYEDFGIMPVEAQACGTPVIAYDHGSVPEIVRDGLTGFVVEPNEGVGGLKKALYRINTIKREDCRKHVEENFAVEKMVKSHEELYKELL
ncbi:MAG: glycosyltransferase [Candidatus Levybacteria bacterium]|nr:glycosyltransferase [Candidatus Levybacteria bacterium]